MSKYSLDKIICIGEKYIQSSLLPIYQKCSFGKRCVVKTDVNYVFKKFTLLCAIYNLKCVDATFYKEVGNISS